MRGARSGTDPERGCVVLHAELDGFQVAVELLDRPELRGRPVAVSAGRSTVASASAQARRDGVHPGMPLGRARRLSRGLVVLEPDPDRYADVSQGVLEILRSVTPLVEPLGPDSVFLDVSGAVRRLGRPTRIARTLADRIADEQSLACSVGVASTKFAARLASGRGGPDGVHLVPAADTVAFLHALEVGALRGVGDKTEEVLRRLGLFTVADVAHTPLATLRRALGHAAGTTLHELAWGRDPRPVVPAPVERSVGAEQSFRTDVDDPDVVRRELLRLSERVAARLRAGGRLARTVSVRVRFADHTTLTRSRSLPEHTDVGRVIHTTAVGLYERLGLERARLRLVGVRAEDLTSADLGHHQLALGERALGWREAEQAVDRAGARFGAGAVRPASLC